MTAPKPQPLMTKTQTDWLQRQLDAVKHKKNPDGRYYDKDDHDTPDIRKMRETIERHERKWKDDRIKKQNKIDIAAREVESVIMGGSYDKAWAAIQKFEAMKF